MLLKYGLIYYSCAETFTFLIHCVECRRAMLGIFQTGGVPSSPGRKKNDGSLPSPKMSSLVPTSHPQSLFLYSMPPDFSCAKHLVYEGGCRVLPWHVQCMLLCQPRIEEEDQMNQWQNERTGVEEQKHGSYARHCGQRLFTTVKNMWTLRSSSTIVLSLPVIYPRLGSQILMIHTARCCRIPSELLLGPQCSTQSMDKVSVRAPGCCRRGSASQTPVG